jgi:SHS family lactate transporter-like MFS transporter
MFKAFTDLTSQQRRAFFASLSGWSLDAFDFFIYTICITSISKEFHATVTAVAEGVFLTLAFRPIGALLFGWLAEKFGRRPILMINILSYSLVELASAFAPSLATLLVLRAVFGLAMGGEWGVGAALALETLPAKRRGFFSGMLQEGYAIGYLLASLVAYFALDRVGWRGMFIIGAAPALLVIFIRMGVHESPAWLAGAAPKRASAASIWNAAIKNLPTLIFLVVLMACFNALSHGTQDLYPAFLEKQHGFSNSVRQPILIVMNFGALLGGILFGSLSERLGRKRAIMLAAALAIPMIYLWAFSTTAVMFAIGAFLMQFMVQGAWGVVPAHLNELSPPAVRAILPGLAYQLGNLAVSKLSVVQSAYADSHDGNLGLALAITVAIVAVVLFICTAFGPEARGADLKVSG